jgi:hypothetical protein
MELSIKGASPGNLKQIIKGQKLILKAIKADTVGCRGREVPRAMKVLWGGLCGAIKRDGIRWDTRIGECETSNGPICTDTDRH